MNQECRDVTGISQRYCNIDHLMLQVFKSAKLLAPSVIFIEDVEKVGEGMRRTEININFTEDVMLVRALAAAL